MIMYYTTIAAFLSSFLLVFFVTLQFGDIADKRWRAVAWEPLIAACGVVGIGTALQGLLPAFGYVVGSTAACTLAMYIRKEGL
jgi:uncharacterized membrane protein YjjB (DUF3815 family)